MRVILANKFYYDRGGDCIATKATERILRQNGHEVAIFAMDYPLNDDSPWHPYFPPAVDFGGSLRDKVRAVGRLFSPSDVRRAFERLLDDFRPDIVHLNNVHSYLSPVMAQVAHDRGVKVVWTMHDYKVVCPSYVCLRGDKPCTECLHDGFAVVKHRCMKGSRLQSLSAWLESLYWNKKRLASLTSCFIAPSEFMRQMLLRAGFDASQVVTIPHCVPRKVDKVYVDKDDYYCYVGRLSREKGVATLLSAARQLRHKLLIVGDGPLRDELSAMAAGCDNIVFCGQKGWDELSAIVGRARFVVTPSQWYEVFGLVNIEAEMLGTPVLASDIGGIPETLVDGVQFKAGDVEDLKSKIEQMYATQFDYASIAGKAHEKYSDNAYYLKLMTVYDNLIASEK